MIAPPLEPKVADLEIPPDLIPNYDEIVIEDDTPVDSIFSERQMRLLTEPLYASWPGPGEGRPFLALANVGLFYRLHHPPLVPDVMLSLDIAPPQDMRPKQNRSYFVWEYGRPPDVVIEIVSNDEGRETDYKLQEYAGMGVRYYVIYDPLRQVQDTPLVIYELRGRFYAPLQTGWLQDVGLGVRMWDGTYDSVPGPWIRWYDAAGELIPTGAERAAAEAQRADTEAQRADTEAQRADVEAQRAEVEAQRAGQAITDLEQLRARLKAMGIDPDSLNEA